MDDAPDGVTAIVVRERPLVSVADVRAANIEFAWFEALAVVATLCRTVAAPDDESATLSEATVFIAADGGVSAVVGTHDPAALVAQAGALLGGLLPDFHRRLTFHSVIANTQAEPPHYPNLEALARVLAPFERPDRETIVQDLYRRWEDMAMANRPVPVPRPVPRAIEIERPPARRPDAPSPSPRNVRRIATLAGVAAAALTSIVIAATLWARAPQDDDSAEEPPAIDHAVDAGLTADIELPAEDGIAEPFVGPMPAPRLTYSATAVDIGGSASPLGSVVARAPQDGAAQGQGASAGSGSAPRTSATGQTGDRHEIAAPEPADHVYTAADRDVTPPTLSTRQQLWSPGSPQGDGSITVEIVVDEQGRVASARGAQRPAHISDTAAVAMSLSAIKSWHFNPAVKDGRPVRYRQMLSIALR